MSVQTQLDRLGGLKGDLAANLTQMGAAASAEEPLSALVPKVLDIRTGVDTSDATALASEIKQSRTAYARGVKITGTCPVAASTEYAGSVTCKKVSSNIQVTGKLTTQKIVPTNTSILMDVPASNFGDATAADVKAGKTFTSASGLKLTGYHTCLGVGQCLISSDLSLPAEYPGDARISFTRFDPSFGVGRWSNTSLNVVAGMQYISLIGYTISCPGTSQWRADVYGDVSYNAIDREYTITGPDVWLSVIRT